MEWIEELRAFQNKEDVIRLEKKDISGLVTSPDLIAFYKKLDELCRLPEAEFYPPMPEDANTWLYIIPKKRHEIKRLAPHIHHLYQQHKPEEVVDIGGGIGLLAQTLNNNYNMKVITLDMDPVLQKTGMERHERNTRNPENKVRYRNIKVSSEGEFSDFLEKKVIPIGLHTCGRLALDIIHTSSQKKVPALVNFGCCYHTLFSNNDFQNISAFAKDHDPLWMTKFALTLSGRAHRKMDEKDYDFKLKVKFFRYAIHILLHDHYDLKELVSLGNSSPKLYDESFGTYVYEQFRRINLEPKHSLEELNTFFSHPELKLLIERMLAAGLIRNALGRAMEIYLLLDRAIYLEEQGYQVKVQEFFNEELSPRNIGITAELVS